MKKLASAKDSLVRNPFSLQKSITVDMQPASMDAAIADHDKSFNHKINAYSNLEDNRTHLAKEFVLGVETKDSLSQRPLPSKDSAAESVPLDLEDMNNHRILYNSNIVPLQEMK